MNTSTHPRDDELSRGAFYNQFSEIVRAEARLDGDNSEDGLGPSRARWVNRHHGEVLAAQARTIALPLQGMRLNVDPAQVASMFNVPRYNSKVSAFALNTVPPSAQPATPASFTHFFGGPDPNNAPWYEHFNLADQGIPDSTGPYRPPMSITRFPQNYRAFDPNELAAYRATVTSQLYPTPVLTDEQKRQALAAQNTPTYVSPFIKPAGKQQNPPHIPQLQRRPNAQAQAFNIGQNPHNAPQPTAVTNNPASAHHPVTQNDSQQQQRPSTPPNQTNNIAAQVPYKLSTPPHRLTRHIRRASSMDSLPGLFASRTSVRANSEPFTAANTEPLTETMGMAGSLGGGMGVGVAAAPEYYEPIEVVAGEVRVGDWIQSVKFPGQTLANSPITLPITYANTPTYFLRLQYQSADGTVRAKAFTHGDKVVVLRDCNGKLPAEAAKAGAINKENEAKVEVISREEEKKHGFKKATVEDEGEGEGEGAGEGV